MFYEKPDMIQFIIVTVTVMPCSSLSHNVGANALLQWLLVFS